MPRFACTGLVQQQGLFALIDGDVVVVLNLLEERRKHLGVVCRPASWDEPPAEKVVGVHELLPSEVFIAERVGTGPIGSSSTEGEAIVTRFGDIPEVVAGGFVPVGGLAALSCEIPQGHILEFPEPLNGICCGALEGHSVAFGIEVNWRELWASFVGFLGRRGSSERAAGGSGPGRG